MPMGATTWYHSIFRRNRNQDGDWFGKYWASYGQAVEEAGFASNKLQEAYGVEALNIRFIELIREIGKIPVKGELLLKRWQDSSFPNEKVFSRCGSKNERIRRVLEYCRSHSGFEDVIQICEQTSLSSEGTPADKPHDGDIGYVYLIKSGKHYKIGKPPRTQRLRIGDTVAREVHDRPFHQNRRPNWHRSVLAQTIRS